MNKSKWLNTYQHDIINIMQVREHDCARYVNLSSAATSLQWKMGDRRALRLVLSHLKKKHKKTPFHSSLLTCIWMVMASERLKRTTGGRWWWRRMLSSPQPVEFQVEKNCYVRRFPLNILQGSASVLVRAHAAFQPCLLYFHTCQSEPLHTPFMYPETINIWIQWHGDAKQRRKTSSVEMWHFCI